MASLRRRVHLSLEYLFYIAPYSRPTYTAAQYLTEQYRQCTYNVTLRRVHVTTLSMAKQ